MTGMLASVANLNEALQVQAAGADIVDLKDPAEGALGALSYDRVREIVNSLDAGTQVSATIGDLPMQPDLIHQTVSAMGATGVDFVKIGLFPGGDWQASIAGLIPLSTAGTALIAVFFGDCDPDTKWFSQLAAAGFTGVMLDTRDKQAGSLPSLCGLEKLREFVTASRGFGFKCGLAGSLRSEDIGPLLALQPDYLGFRGALCVRRQRADQLDPEAMQAIRGQIS